MTSAEAQDTIFELSRCTPALMESAEKVDDPILEGFGETGADGDPLPAIAEMGAVWTFWGATELSIVDGSAPDPAGAWDTMITNIEGEF